MFLDTKTKTNILARTIEGDTFVKNDPKIVNRGKMFRHYCTYEVSILRFWWSNNITKPVIGGYLWQNCPKRVNWEKMTRHYRQFNSILCNILANITNICTYDVSILRFWWSNIILKPVIDWSGDSLLPLSVAPRFLIVKYLVDITL